MLPASVDTKTEWSSHPASTSHGLAICNNEGADIAPIGRTYATSSTALYNAPLLQVYQNTVSNQIADQSAKTTSATTQDLADGLGCDGNQPWSQEDVDRILSSLQESLPDVGRLFDGSIGMF